MICGEVVPPSVVVSSANPVIPVVMCPMDPAVVNQMLPSGPAAMPMVGELKPKCVNAPLVVILPIPVASVNHSAPSGPAVIWPGLSTPVWSMMNVVTAPVVVI